MDRVKRNSHFLRYLGSIQSSAQRRSLLESASVDQISSLAEIAYNILSGVFELTDPELSSLRRYKSVLRKVASSEIRPVEKRSVLVENSIAVKHLLAVFFTHIRKLEDGFRRDSTTYSNTSEPIQTVDSESEASTDGEPD